MREHREFTFFPKKLGLFPYVFLLYLLMPAFNLVQQHGWKSLFGWTLLLMFLVTYRQLYWVEIGSKAFDGLLLAQMAIILGLTLVNGPYNIFLGFFSGNFIAYYYDRQRSGVDFDPQRKFRNAMVIFLGVLLVPVFMYIRAIIQGKADAAGLGFFIPFILIMYTTPFGMRSMYRNRHLREELDRANERIKELVKREERIRIARDLHDTLGHTLSLITLKSQLVEKLAMKNPERAREEAKEIERTSRAALKQVRELVSDMRAIKVSEELAASAEMLKAAGITYEIQGEVSLEGVSELTQNIISLCIKEAVTNIVKHSGAEHCDINLKREGDAIKLMVEDDGAGIPDELKDSLGNGLKGMTERLALIEGSLELSPGNNKGTKLSVIVPIPVKEMNGGERS
ncbi:histidine kinase [Paenibacillus puldeungensis]|uniref:histidine kinase n=1 Tax=Paenibacillus puldeungensis TaxID=696536 RepID=A0ABW3S4M1_9BACL